MTLATITSKGQVTIPVDIRKQLHLNPGDTIDFRLEANGTARLFPFSRKVGDVYGLLASADRSALSVEEQDEALKQAFRDRKS